MLLKLFFSHLLLVSNIFLLTQGNFFPSPGSPPPPPYQYSREGAFEGNLKF